MPTILLKDGWRFFFFANENNEPMHIHCKKAEKNIKFWIDEENFLTKVAYSFEISAADKKFLKNTILEHFEYIVAKWHEFERSKQ